MAADAVFEGWVNRAINFDIDVIISHVVITSALAWLTAGYFRAAVISSSWNAGSKPATGAVGVSPTVAPGGNANVNERGDRETAHEKVDVSSPHVSEGSTDHKAPDSTPNAAAPQAETRPSGSVSTPAEKTTSFVANIAAEHTEPENALPNNASILEHINISDAPDWSGERPAPLEGEAANDQPALVRETPTAPVKRDWQNIDNSKLPSVFTLGTVETVIILGLVDLLFAGFVAAQLPYLFGGMELVQNTPDFKLAEYARRGFGELVFVSALVLPMLLLSHWLIRRDGSRAEGVFRLLAGIQIGLLFVIMASAVQRLLLYTGEFGYGLTVDRFYPMVLMIWLAIVFGWFAATVLVRNARSRFAWGALWAAVVVLGATNLLNPHAFIARTNIQLMQQGRDFDAYYNADLSDDAIPVLIESFEHFNSEDAVSMFYRFRYRACRKAETREGDLRSWNLSRAEASRTLTAVGIPIAESAACKSNWHGD
jgi:hypothetical protein